MLFSVIISLLLCSLDDSVKNIMARIISAIIEVMIPKKNKIIVARNIPVAILKYEKYFNLPEKSILHFKSIIPKTT